MVMVEEPNSGSYAEQLGRLGKAVEASLTRLRKDRVPERIWKHDHTVWKPEPAGIANRLGWLHCHRTMRQKLPAVASLSKTVRREGFTRALLLGMGGSSLSAEVYRFIFGVGKDALDLSVLDSTDPGAVLETAGRHDPAKTLYLVSTKSGGTIETLSFFKYFYNEAVGALGARKAARHFVAVTDPGSSLAALAEGLGFRTTFLNDPDIGGRYSALSLFGLVPAALIGIDPTTLLDRAGTAAETLASGTPEDEVNNGVRMGAVFGTMARKGRDKLTLALSPALRSLGAWIEQLVAESTGKEGKGILPIDGEPLGPPEAYGDDRLFVALRMREEGGEDPALEALRRAGHPVLVRTLADPYELGAEFLRWEVATAVAGSLLDINPFDQPNVESAKVSARKMVEAFKMEGRIPTLDPDLEEDGITVFGETSASTPDEALSSFLSRTRKGGYVALQAFVQPTETVSEAFRALQAKARALTGRPVTLGWGPRFLHSTGQLHKGDAGRGRFVQFTGDMPADAPVPDEPGSSASSITFGILKTAQALGDRSALLDAGRRVLTLHLGGDVAGALERLTEALAAAQK